MSDMAFRFPPVPRCPMFGCFCFTSVRFATKKPRAQSGGSGPMTWRAVVNKHGDGKSPKDRVVGPLPNGRTPWHINEGDSNHLQVLG